MVAQRHRIDLELEPVINISQTLITSLPNLNSVASLVTSNNMNPKSKYNAAFRIAQEIANKAKTLKQTEFQHVIEQLTKINEFLLNKTEFNVVALNENDVTLRDERVNTSNENNQNNDHGDEISNSQSSTVSFDSYLVSNKKIGLGKSVGRNKSKKSKLDPNMGQLSKYTSNGTNIDAQNTTTTTTLSIVSTELNLTTNLKSVFQKRAFEILNNIIVNKLRIKEIILGTLIIEESNLIVDPSLFTSKTYSIYDNYFKSSKEFRNFFNDDAFLLFEDVMKRFVLSKECVKIDCKLNFDVTSVVKVCYLCYETYHIACTEGNANNKKFKCSKCKI